MHHCTVNTVICCGSDLQSPIVILEMTTPNLFTEQRICWKIAQFLLPYPYKYHYRKFYSRCCQYGELQQNQSMLKAAVVVFFTISGRQSQHDVEKPVLMNMDTSNYRNPGNFRCQKFRSYETLRKLNTQKNFNTRST